MVETSTALPQLPRRAVQTTVADAMVSIPKVLDASTSVHEVRALFDDDHVHAALILGDRGVLITVVERADIPADLSHDCPAATLGMVQGRIVSSDSCLAGAQQLMLKTGRRRLAVVDTDGRLVGLLCLKRSRTGFCSDQDVLARLAEAQR